MPTFTFSNNNGFDVFFYWFTPSGTPTGEGSVTSRERTKTFDLDLPAGTELRFTTEIGTWDLTPPGPRVYHIKGITFDAYTTLGDDRQTHTIRDVSTRFHIRNRSASQVFLFTVDPHSGNEVAAGNLLPNNNYQSWDAQGALKPSTTWRIKDAAGAVLKTYVTTDANYQEIEITPMALRKNQRSLTAAEKKRFIDALLALKAERKPNAALNTYDLFVKWHDDAMNANKAHMGPAFLAWHREYLRRFELELQRISPPEPSTGGEVLGLPYWDWSIDRDSTSWPFTADFLGGNGLGETHKVMDGPFAYDKGKWPLTVFPQHHIGDPDPDPSDSSPYLRRQIGADPDFGSLPSMENVRTTLAATPFDSAPWNDMSQSGFRNMLEGFRRDMQKNPPEPLPSQMHNRVHRYIGGTMGPPTSPYDPVFWLHHCYVDKLWADWQRLHPNEPGYLPDGPAPTGHNLKDIMEPWKDKAPKDVLNILELGYRYD